MSRLRSREDLLIGRDPPPDGLIRLTVKMERSDGQFVTSVTLMSDQPEVCGWPDLSGPLERLRELRPS